MYGIKYYLVLLIDYIMSVAKLIVGEVMGPRSTLKARIY
jgi:hypothetical protein